MKTFMFGLLAILLGLGVSCAPELPVDPRTQWLGSWGGDVTTTTYNYGSSCSSGSSSTSTGLFPGTLIITASAFDPNGIVLSSSLIKTEAVVSGSTGILEDTNTVTFQTNLTLTAGKLKCTYRVSGSGSSCTNYGSSYTSYVPHVFEMELTKK